MKLTRGQLRTIINDVLVESTALNKDLYGSLEKAIADSRFWLEGNTEDDGEYEDVKEFGLMHQTGAGQYLQDALQFAIDGIDTDIVVSGPSLLKLMQILAFFSHLISQRILIVLLQADMLPSHPMAKKQLF